MMSEASLRPRNSCAHLAYLRQENTPETDTACYLTKRLDGKTGSALSYAGRSVG